MHSSLLIFGRLSWSGLTVGSPGLIRPDVADGPKSAIALAIAGYLLDQQCGIAQARAGSAAATRRHYGSEGRGLDRAAISPTSTGDAGAGCAAVWPAPTCPPAPHPATSHRIEPSSPSRQSG